MTDRNIIGQKIADLRKNRGMTQAELADKLGVSHQAVSQWERNETLPDILTLPLIAEIFDERIANLLGVEEIRAVEPVQAVEQAEEGIPVDFDRIMADAEGLTIEEEREKIHLSIIKKLTGNKSQTNVSCDGYSLPVGNETLRFGKDTYEIVLVKNGSIVQKFVGSPDEWVKITLHGSCYSLRSEITVTVEGEVGGDAHCGFGMTVNGNIGGNAQSGFEMHCGDVAGNANAGFGLYCRDIGGSASGGFGVKASGTKNTAASDDGVMYVGRQSGDEEDNEDDGNISLDGKYVTIEGDYNGDLSLAASVTVEGDVNGDVSCDSLSVDGDVQGDINATGSVSVGGDVGGEVGTTADVTVGGDVGGNVNTCGNVTAGGDVNGHVETTGNVTVGCDIDGNVNTCGTVAAGGDIDGHVETTGEVHVGGDVSGDIETQGSVTVEGDVDGDIHTEEGDVTVEGDVNGNIRAKSITVEGDYNA